MFRSVLYQFTYVFDETMVEVTQLTFNPKLSDRLKKKTGEMLKHNVQIPYICETCIQHKPHTTYAKKKCHFISHIANNRKPCCSLMKNPFKTIVPPTIMFVQPQIQHRFAAAQSASESVVDEWCGLSFSGIENRGENRRKICCRFSHSFS